MFSLLRWFLVVVFYSIARAGFQVGVLAPEEFQWSSFGESSVVVSLAFVCYLHEKLLVIHC